MAQQQQESSTQPQAQKGGADNSKKEKKVSNGSGTGSTAARKANGSPRLLNDELRNVLNQLNQKIEPGLIKQREGWRDRNGNVHMVDYVEWHTVADILDKVAPAWSHTVTDIKCFGDIIAITAAINVNGVVREGIGTGSSETELGIKKAEHDALKRAAVKFGVGRELYKKEADLAERHGGAENRGGNGMPQNPVAKSVQDLVTAKQLGMIRAIGREIGVDVDAESEALAGCKTDEFSKKAASAFIGHLQQLQAGATPLSQGGSPHATAARPDSGGPPVNAAVEPPETQNAPTGSYPRAVDSPIPTNGPNAVPPTNSMRVFDQPDAFGEAPAPINHTQNLSSPTPMPQPPQPAADANAAAVTEEPLSLDNAKKVVNRLEEKIPGANADEICARVKNGRTLMQLSRSEGLEFYRVLKEDPDKIRKIWDAIQAERTPPPTPTPVASAPKRADLSELDWD